MKKINKLSWEDTRYSVKEGKSYINHFYYISGNEIYVNKGESIQIVDKNNDPITILKNISYGTGDTITI